MAKETKNQTAPTSPAPPKLVRRRENQKSAFKLGRTIGEKREKLETANERAAIYQKNRRKKIWRIVLTVLGFSTLALILILISRVFFEHSKQIVWEGEEELVPTIEIIDEATNTGDQITTRMRTFIARAERDLRTLGYSPKKVVIPTDKIREVDFYLENYSGFIKMTIDRNPAVSAEDAERMLRYLSEKAITDFTYIDVRIDGKAYWK